MFSVHTFCYKIHQKWSMTENPSSFRCPIRKIRQVFVNPYGKSVKFPRPPYGKSVKFSRMFSSRPIRKIRQVFARPIRKIRQVFAAVFACVFAHVFVEAYTENPSSFRACFRTCFRACFRPGLRHGFRPFLHSGSRASWQWLSPAPAHQAPQHPRSTSIWRRLEQFPKDAHLTSQLRSLAWSPPREREVGGIFRQRTAAYETSKPSLPLLQLPPPCSYGPPMPQPNPPSSYSASLASPDWRLCLRIAQAVVLRKRVGRRGGAEILPFS